MSPLDLAIEQIRKARSHTLRLLETIEPVQWFRQPKEGITHVAWQVGHLAMAQYRLCLERIRGPRDEDAALISEGFLTQFGRDSVPDPDPTHNPSPEEIRLALDRVYAQVMQELPKISESDLSCKPLKPHPLFDTKLGALLWCGHHEMAHAGQIGLLRRLLGHSPLW